MELIHVLLKNLLQNYSKITINQLYVQENMSEIAKKHNKYFANQLKIGNFAPAFKI